MAKIGINILTNTHEVKLKITFNCNITYTCYNQISMNLAVNARVTIAHQMKDHVYKFHVGSVTSDNLVLSDVEYYQTKGH